MTKHSDPQANENGRLPGAPKTAGWRWVRVELSTTNEVQVGITRIGWFTAASLTPEQEQQLGEHCAPKVEQMRIECEAWGRTSSRRSAEDRRS